VEELGEGPRGTSNEPALPPAPAPRWLDRLGLAYCLIGGVQLVQSLMSLGTPLRVFHLGSLLPLTGLAMLFRRRWLRSVALALNAGSLVLTIPPMIYYWFGSPKPGWSVGVAGWPSGVGIPWLPWVLATLQILLFVAGLYVLLRREIAALFIKRPTVVSGISTWAITGAVLVGLSLPAPLMILLAILSGGGGIGLFELWVALGSVALPGLGGTLLGWLGLNEIRESHGRLRGLPLAMFATLFWPLGLFVGLTLVFPMYFLARASEPSAGPNVGRVLVLLLPAAVIAFSFWSIHATARWATQKPTDRKRGILKWIFVGAIVVGMGLVMMTAPSRHAEPAERPQPIISFTPVNTEPEVPQPIQANFRIPKGQAAARRRTAGAHRLLRRFRRGAG
jgi:hypothetical protein